MNHIADDKNNKTNNIVLFPNLHNRLISKGLEALGNKDFKQSVHLFIQAREFDSENSEVNLGLLVSLVELQNYEEARTLCKEILNQGIGDYFQIMSIYLMVLLQLGEHEEMVKTIELLIQENQIPFDKMEQFEQMLSFSKKAIQEKQNEAERKEEEWQKELQQEELFIEKDDPAVLDTITKLSKINVRPFVNEIQAFLKGDENHPFFKTLLLNILREQDYSYPIELTKFSKTVTIIPSQLEELSNLVSFKNVNGLIESVLSQQDPSLLEMTQSLIERHYFVLYPFDPEQDGTCLAAAYHALAEEYMTGQEAVSIVASIYHEEEQRVRDCIKYLKMIDEFSYPNI